MFKCVHQMFLPNVSTLLPLVAFDISFNDRLFWKLLNMVADLTECELKVVEMTLAFWRMPIILRSRVFEVNPFFGGT